MDVKIRTYSLDCLKAVSAFFVVIIHWGLDRASTIDQVLLTVTNVAVPIFFMITGYFYPCFSNMKGGFGQYLFKIARMLVMAQVVYIVFSVGMNLLRGRVWFYPMSSIRDCCVTMVIEHTPPYGYHLWYFYALIVALVIMWTIGRCGLDKIGFLLIPVLFIANEILSYIGIYVRNFLFMALPYLYLGYFVHVYEDCLLRFFDNGKLLVVFTVSCVLTMIDAYIQYNYWGRLQNQYLFLTLVVFCIFLYALRYPYSGRGSKMALNGKAYSSHIYIWHILVGNCMWVLLGFLDVGIPRLYGSSVLSGILAYVLTLFCVRMIIRIK